ncbi:hypothetical protein BC792_102109 [Sphingobacterium allocomposti]|jgi:hypothetical protein|uniref:DUF4397 domain-containing protein n=1 Tax=Sphingobacterium allocomposti TaxID=415956 RepID=A0A5S5DP49_9SPHI|nr:DUF4397 domain-containing protein [Sphingobacterium composti Yoo et al. 2007 non Ten et al. 2007]TYP97687.1 hypothetical protein BC792_102109 [Sphingobacterium composti Yoo et al. 2007 non Ten et al. 2007]HLS94844.1 DUF4397 domain-containing protein [Sphingobacterium sp.]
MKKISIQLLGTLLFSLVFFAGCLKDEDRVPVPAGFMTFVNAFTSPEGLYYQIDGRTLNAGYAPIMFRGYSTASLYVGNRNLRAMSASQNKTIVDSTITVRDSTAYSSFVYGTPAQPKFAMTQDKVIDNLGDKTAFRFFNLANGVSEVSLFIGDSSTPAFADRPVETGASAVQHQTFVAKESGSFRLEVRDADGNKIAERDSYNFTRGYYYSILLIGTKEDNSMPLYIGVIPH